MHENIWGSPWSSWRAGWWWYTPPLQPVTSLLRERSEWPRPSPFTTLIIPSFNNPVLHSTHQDSKEAEEASRLAENNSSQSELRALSRLGPTCKYLSYKALTEIFWAGGGGAGRHWPNSTRKSVNYNVKHKFCFPPQLTWATMRMESKTACQGHSPVQWSPNISAHTSFFMVAWRKFGVPWKRILREINNFGRHCDNIRERTAVQCDPYKFGSLHLLCMRSPREWWRRMLGAKSADT